MDASKLSPFIQKHVEQYGLSLRAVESSLKDETAACVAFLEAVTAHGAASDEAARAQLELESIANRREVEGTDAARAAGRLFLAVSLEDLGRQMRSTGLDLNALVMRHQQTMAGTADSGAALFDAMDAWVQAWEHAGIGSEHELGRRAALMEAMDARKAALTAEALAMVRLTYVLRHLPKERPTERPT
ncbi:MULTISPECIES: hypothetical protein [unclassified Corallococcus]|uniref:hypothetical protein n=1 Tax=unclassified Corallococcus TaxID=2685029 RepID=UPI001A8E40D9|nr:MULTISPECIES: hypothetical protein [unclassified Corallococcus]MBN9685380.1 hypothetical protein [Corallococcus sp. NCSPR001]WAS83169.1 hypothetical protein O0N60_28090 [Corallococcus sp. NCRR]